MAQIVRLVEGRDSASLLADIAYGEGIPVVRGAIVRDCPWCGKPAKPGQVHFRITERGAYCFVCGRGMGLAAYRAWRFGLTLANTPAARPVKLAAATPPPSWWAEP